MKSHLSRNEALYITVTDERQNADEMTVLYLLIKYNNGRKMRKILDFWQNNRCASKKKYILQLT